MICNHCKQQNPDSNRFCGMCGASLTAQEKSEQPSPQLETPPPELSAPVVTTASAPAEPLPASEPPTPPAIRMKEIQMKEERSAGSLGGHSFLGLSVEDDPPDEIESEFHGRPPADDLYRANWAARLLVVLVIILIVGALAWLQWQSQRNLKASPARNWTAAVAGQPPAPPSSEELQKQERAKAGAAQSQTEPSPTNLANGAKSSDGKPAESPLQPTASASAASATSTVAQPGSSAGNSTASGDQLANKTAAVNSTQTPEVKDSTAAANSAPKKETATSSESEKLAQSSATASSANSKVDSSPASEIASPGTARQSREPAGARTRRGNAEQDSEEPVRLAENYLEGRGVPRNCDEGVGILRMASHRGNTRALIKLGALYATGNCVAMDRVTAYQYFSRAKQAEPNNTWLEQSRSMLWANMSDAERKQALEVER